MFFLDVYDKLASEATDSHGDDVGVWNSSFDPREKPEEGVTGEDVVQVLVG